MSYNLFLDDERYPPDDGQKWTIARTSEEAIHAVTLFGVPEFISFDHDLGGDDTSIVFINWLISAYQDGKVHEFPTRFYVHSQNPVGARNIQMLMDGFIRFIQRN